MRNLRQAQHVLAVAGLYTGSLDGVDGPKTRAAVVAVAATSVQSVPASRRPKAAAQYLLNQMGYEAGTVDGYWGHNSQNAYEAMLYEKTHGKKLKLDREPIRSKPEGNSVAFPRQRDCAKFYGKPGKGSSQVARQLVRVPTYEMGLDWNMRTKVTSISLHKKCADSAAQAFVQVEEHYGYARLKRLGLTRFAGSYNPRKMRGGSSWSMHAYACAIDFDARPNGLTMRCPQAKFCDPEYTDFFDIWEAHGWVSLGRAIGRDWMHIQAARL